jgi:hypothetical protein
MKRLAPCVIALCALMAGCRAGKPANSAREASGAAQARPAEPPRVREKYAVLVNGDTERRHKENITRAYTTLRALGFEPAHIFVVSPPDRRGRLVKQTLRLAPVPDNFWRVMDELVETVGKNDLLMVYGTGHGDTDQGDSLLELRNGEVWPADLREEVDQCRGDSVIVMDQCFSGGFADAFQGTKSRVIAISSVDKGHLTDCYAFAKTFWESFLHPERADANHDGRTSVREAFDAALKAHQEALAGDPEVSASGVYRAFNGFDDVLLK